MQIDKATEHDRIEIIRLLKSNNLPADDLPAELHDFFAAIEDGNVVGLVGMERYDEYGLPRSMVVHPDHRNKQIAEKLVDLLEGSAKETGITVMYLLTETAEKYFSRKNYKVITRTEVPAALLKSSEFSHVCPASATVMMKQLVNQLTTA